MVLNIEIHPQEVEDAERLFEIMTNPNFPAFTNAPKTLEDERLYIQSNRFSKDNKNFSIILDGEVVGAIGIKICCRRPHIGEIGYFIDEKHWGKGIALQAVTLIEGIALQAVTLIEEIAFNQLGIVRLEVVMQPKNVRSEKVVIKAGFEKEGILSKVIKDREGNYKDVYIYAKTI